MPDDAPRHLLVIDDDLSVLELLADICMDAGFHVTAATAVPSTVEVAQLAPDLLIVDHRLQGETGRAAIGRLTADPATAHIPAVLCTADYDAANEVTSDPATAIAVVRKPFDLDQFLTVVDDALRHQCSGEGSGGRAG